MTSMAWLTRIVQNRDASERTDDDDPSSALEYVDWLLTHMFSRNLLRLVISPSVPLPAAPALLIACPRPPDHQTVINRLKIMVGLNPFPCRQPQGGRIERPRGDVVVIFDVHFDDTVQPPQCIIHLRVRRRAT